MVWELKHQVDAVLLQDRAQRPHLVHLVVVRHIGKVVEKHNFPQGPARLQIGFEKFALGRPGFEFIGGHGPALSVIDQGRAVQGDKVGIAVIEGVVVLGLREADEFVEKRGFLFVVAEA